MCNKNRFSYDSDDLFETITVKNMDKDYFQFGDMENIIIESEQDKERVKSYQSKMKDITNYFDDLISSNPSDSNGDSKGWLTFFLSPLVIHLASWTQSPIPSKLNVSPSATE